MLNPENSPVFIAKCSIQRMLLRNLDGLVSKYLACLALIDDCSNQNGKTDWKNEAELAKSIAIFCYGQQSWDQELGKHS